MLQLFIVTRGKTYFNQDDICRWRPSQLLVTKDHKPPGLMVNKLKTYINVQSSVFEQQITRFEESKDILWAADYVLVFV